MSAFGQARSSISHNTIFAPNPSNPMSYMIIYVGSKMMMLNFWRINQKSNQTIHQSRTGLVPRLHYFTARSLQDLQPISSLMHLTSKYLSRLASIQKLHGYFWCFLQKIPEYPSRAKLLLTKPSRSVFNRHRLLGFLLSFDFMHLAQKWNFGGTDGFPRPMALIGHHTIRPVNNF